MQLIQVSLLALLSSYVAAQDVDNDDVPIQCRSVCTSIVTLTQDCDRLHDDNDRSYLDCVCNGTNAATEIPVCEACVANFDRDGADNDVNDLVRSCSFSRTTYVSMTASPTASTSGGPTAAGGSQTTLTGSQTSPAVTESASSVINSLSSVLSSATNSEQIASVSSSIASLTSAAANPTDTSAASANSVKAAGVFGAVVLGMIGLA
ncbi:hypothetical protein ONS95_005485 [Cadophora gregata]|uniref:uncharacterized protein n=1 Tax=Cadophora gregata TaxID=51156 RepID=UPI0026DCDD68|nr:uncharacterized protein ONS95_005485 [Cadophora gregata]KAK0103462.1 hypothetical protein ONS95_005485 [Cadophora gregata]KAK0107652.1 hypothetical protein ONS96_003455 [Cadophora gregata f. sp. sojae]